MTRPVILVAAVADNGVIGRDNQLIWRLKSDLRRFRALTMGKPLIMGRKTYDSIGRPLPGRETIVLTRDPAFSAPGVHVAHDLDAALALAEHIGEQMAAPEIVVAGGGDVYAQALPRADGLRLTRVHVRPEGDATFPPYDAAAFRETLREEHAAGPEDEHPFTFIDLERRRPAKAG